MMLLFFIFFEFVVSDNWAILLSGAYDWDSLGYAADSDVYQSYYELIHSGFDPDKIIVFCMNNSAYNQKNVHPGVVFNYPGGPNTYPFIADHMDYVFRQNTPENFLKVLRGEDMTGIGSGRTLKSTEEDIVFIASTQHGAPGILEFIYTDPKTDFELMYAADVISTLRTMQEKKMFKNLVWYMTACYSGSIWNKEFKDDENIFIVTGAPVERSAISCDYSPEMKVPINSCTQIHWKKYNWKNSAQNSLYTQFVNGLYSLKQTSMTFVEEYCCFGNIEGAKTLTIAEVQGTYKAPRNEFNENHIAIPLITKFRDHRRYFGENQGEEVKVRYHPYTTIPIKGFDSDNIHCYSYPKVNEECAKTALVYLMDNYGFLCLVKQNINPNSFLDWVRDGCSSDQGTIDPIYLIDEIKKVCGANSTANY